MTGEPIDPAALDLLRDGALTVSQAAEFSGICRTDLFGLMNSGELVWFRRGKARLIPRRALVELLARLYEFGAER